MKRHSLLGHRERGFSLIEVMVTILVLSIGFLGLAKMQAAAVSNTQVARIRSLVSMQAGSLVAAMHSNPAYWRALSATFTVRATGTTVNSSSSIVNGMAAGACVGLTSAACSAEQLAGADLATWVGNLNTAFPGYNASVTCAALVANVTPATCTITVQWIEKYVAGNRAANSTAMTDKPMFTLMVEP